MMVVAAVSCLVLAVRPRNIVFTSTNILVLAGREDAWSSLYDSFVVF
jgi:hypothetical protein